MMEKQDDPRMKSQKQNITRFEKYRHMIKADLNEALEALKEAQKSCLDQGSGQMELFAAEKLHPEIDRLKNLIRHVESLVPENIKGGS
ncbi:MAG: hypothetical protein R6V02_05020 [Candidatus Aminicenantes bacterium]